MNQEIAVVDQHPFGVLIALDAGRVFAELSQLRLNFVGDGLDLPGIGAGAHQEVIGERGDLAHIQQHEVSRLLRFGGVHGGNPERFRFVQYFRPRQVTVLLLTSYYNRDRFMWLLFLAAVLACAADSPDLAQARQHLDQVRHQAADGLLPATAVHDAEEAVDDASDESILDQTLYGDLTEEQASSMVAAAERRVARTEAKVEQGRKLVEAGVAERLRFADLDAESARRKQALEQARGRAALISQIVDMAREESNMPEPAPGRAEEHVTGGNMLEAKDIKDITLAFEKEFDKPLPVSAKGSTAVHRAMGFDHTGRIDVAVTPDSPEGVWLRKYLESKDIPYYAFRSAIAGKATGSHIHIGPGSTRIHASD